MAHQKTKKISKQLVHAPLILLSRLAIIACAMEINYTAASFTLKPPTLPHLFSIKTGESPN